MKLTAARMKRNLTLPVFAALASMFLQACTEPPSHEEIIREDLLEIIETLGEPCGQVVGFEAKPGISYSVTCETGDHYEISVSPEGKINIRNHD